MKIADVFFAAQLDDAGLQADASKAGDKAGKTLGASISTSLKQSAQAGFGLAGGAVAFNILKNSIGDVTAALGDMVSGAIDEEKISARLDQALKTNVANWDGNRSAIDAYIDAQVRRGFQDDDTTAAMAQLVTATGNVAEAQTFLNAAMDLARLKGISLAEATDALTKIEGGSFRILKGLGIELEKGATKTEALAAVQKVAAGQADAFAKTSAGSMAIWNAKLDQAKDKIGRGLLPVVATAANALGDFFDLVTGGTEAWIKDLGIATSTILVQKSSYESLQAQEEKLLEARRELLNNPFALQKDLDVLDDMIAKVRALELATAATVPMFHDSSEAVKALNQAARDATPVFDANAGAIDTVTTAAEKAAPKLYDMFRQYTVAITRGDVAQDTLDLYDNARAVTAAQLAVEKATPGTAAYRKAQLELTVAQGKLASAHERLLEDQIKLFNQKPDVATAKKLDKYFQNLGLGIGRLEGAAKDAYVAVQKLLHPATGDANVQIIVRYGGKPQKLAAGGPVTAGVPVIVGDAGRPELFVPDVNGRIVPEVPSSMAVHGSAGPVINNYVNLDGYVKARDPFEIGNTLRRLGEFGMLTPRPEYG